MLRFPVEEVKRWGGLLAVRDHNRGAKRDLRFPPSKPPIALQSFTRDAPFSQVDGETPCSMVRSDAVRDGGVARPDADRVVPLNT